MEDKQKIKTLTVFFTAGLAAFTVVEAVSNMYGGNSSYKPKHKEMEDLYKQALEELKKDDPDLGMIDRILFQLQTAIEKPQPKFPLGGTSIE
jgi:hypothetical protein